MMRMKMAVYAWMIAALALPVASLAFFGCEEYSSLKQALREYEAKHKR